ncbi:hypothetical protein [Amycolatopsis decaplanina]|uniref:Uncharacterized protein n=1 Tax=Amycolatopsis decaplanina DSM 44594 TaxID=1284240 RepID=M2YUN6_9PSEU|nr:hypothetical protein [Amycolatopsis decaplanina]EME52433.1 hypothetical protein H074_33039 [Amycolatopsis decaplanina DSM 44594]
MICDIPRPGDIGLRPVPGAIGWLIRVGHWLIGDGFGDFGHAFCVLRDGLILEQCLKGARIQPLAKYEPFPGVYVSPAGLSDEQRAAICDVATRYVGTPYSFRYYAGLAARRLHLIFPGSRRPETPAGRMVCSQLVDRIYLDAGVQLFADGRWFGHATPMALWRLLGEDRPARPQARTGLAVG